MRWWYPHCILNVSFCHVIPHIFLGMITITYLFWKVDTSHNATGLSFFFQLSIFQANRFTVIIQLTHTSHALSLIMNIYNVMPSSLLSAPSRPDNLDFINMYFQGLLEKALQRNFIKDSFCLFHWSHNHAHKPSLFAWRISKKYSSYGSNDVSLRRVLQLHIARKRHLDNHQLHHAENNTQPAANKEVQRNSKKVWNEKKY